MSFNIIYVYPQYRPLNVIYRNQVVFKDTFSSNEIKDIVKCLNRTSLRPVFGFEIDRCLNKQRFLTLGLYLKFSSYRIPFHLEFGLIVFHCNLFSNILYFVCMTRSGLLFQWASIINPTRRVTIVQSVHHHAIYSCHDITEKLLFWH